MQVRESRAVEARLALGEFLWDAGDQSRAFAEWKAAEQLEPRNPRVIDHLAECAIARGEMHVAAALYSRALSIEPRNAARHFAFANVCFVFRHEQLEPAHPDAADQLGQALEHFAEASRLAPTNADYARAYAECFYALPAPDWEAALAAWKHFETITANPNFALVHLARVSLKLGQLGAASAYLEKLQLPDGKGIKARLAGQLEEAIRRR